METIEISENLKAHFLRLYQLAICDDDFSSLELKMLYQFAEQRNITSKILDDILLKPINSKVSVPETMEEKIEYLFDFVIMIWADGRIDDNERTALEKYIRMFGFLEENISGIADYFLYIVKQGKSKIEILKEL